MILTLTREEKILLCVVLSVAIDSKEISLTEHDKKILNRLYDRLEDNLKNKGE